MGKLNMGILGGFSGTVGTVVGSVTRKGDNLIRVKSKRLRTSSSVKQMNQRTKFSVVTKFMHPLNTLLRIGFKFVAGDLMSAYNYGCQNALKNAITGLYPEFELDYSKVLISQGKLSKVNNTTFAMTEGTINFHWEDNIATGIGEPTDKSVLLIYNENNNQLSYSVGASTRVSKTGLLPLPNAGVGDKLLLFLFFQSALDLNIVSTSQFVGSVIVAE